MTISFTKAHGAGNDFLLTWDDPAHATPPSPTLARAICDRHCGIGADGWMLVSRAPAIRLFNADGSEAEISGNGTRCAAALLKRAGLFDREVRIKTGAGEKTLRLVSQTDLRFVFEMNMGVPQGAPGVVALDSGRLQVMILNVGNPQCAVIVDEFPNDWRETASAIEAHPMFPRRTNVSFLKILDRHAIEAMFFERGVGETLSSGTGSTGAAAAAILSGLADSPITVKTGAGDLQFRWERGGDAYLTGPAEITGQGEFFYSGPAA